MVLSRAHTVKQTPGKINSMSRGIVRRAAPAPPNRNLTNLTLTLTQRDTDYHKKSNSFFCGPCATFPQNFVKIRRLVFSATLLTNKQINDDENITSLAELIIFIIHHYNGHFTSKPGSDG